MWQAVANTRGMSNKIQTSSTASVRKPGRRARAYQMVTEQLREAISRNDYPTGRLPTERVLSIRHSVSVGTIRKALDLLESEGVIVRRQGSGTYISRPNSTPAIIGSRRTHLICYLSGTGTESYIGNFFNRLMLAVQAEVERTGYATVLAGARAGTVPMPVLKQKVDGVIFAGTYQSRSNPGMFTRENVRENNEFITRVVEAGLPVVAISNPTDCQTVYRVNADYDAAIRTALQHLKDLGHRRIAVYGGPRAWPAFGQRIEAFLRQTAALGLESGEHLVGEHTQWAYINPREVVRTVQEHIQRNPGITAAIVVSGAPTLVQEGITSAGRRCPQDVSLIAFSDLPRPKPGQPLFYDPDDMIAPGIATLTMPVEQLAREAVLRLVALLEGRTFTPEQRDILVPLPFDPAESVAPPPAIPADSYP